MLAVFVGGLVDCSACLGYGGDGYGIFGDGFFSFFFFSLRRVWFIVRFYCGLVEE